MDYISKQKNKIMNNKYYLINPTLYYIHQLGFHYSLNDENYILLLPIFKIKGKPALICKLVYNIVDNILMYDIIKPNNEHSALYYDREFGNAKEYIKRIDSIVNRKIKAMEFKKKKHVNKKQKNQ